MILIFPLIFKVYYINIFELYLHMSPGIRGEENALTTVNLGQYPDMVSQALQKWFLNTEL